MEKQLPKSKKPKNTKKTKKQKNYTIFRKRN